MSNQSSERVIAALKRESTYGTAEDTGAGAERIRLLDSPGLKFTRGEVASEERRPDQLENASSLGGHDVDGSYITEINPGGFFDELLESAVRGTASALAQQSTIDTDTQLTKVAPPLVPIPTGYTVEQNDLDIDESELFYGVRLTGVDFAFQPRQKAKATWMFKGLSRNLIATGASPWFTSPNATTGDSLIVDSALITYAGSVVTTLTGANVSIKIDNAMQDVIGSLVNNDVYLNRLKVSGDVSAIRQDLTALTAFDAGTEFAMILKLTAPGSGERLTFALHMPRVKIYDIDAPFLGGDAAKVETRQFKAFSPLGAYNVIELYSSTDTPTAYGA